MFKRLFNHINGFSWDNYLKNHLLNLLKRHKSHLQIYYVPLYLEFNELKTDITPDVVKDVKENRAIFLFDNTGEGCDGAIHTVQLLKTLYELGLTNEDLLTSTLLTSNMADEVFVESVFTKHWPGLHIGVNMYMWGAGWRSASYTQFNTSKPHKFICLNNSDKKHKNIIVNHLDDNGYSEKGIVTYLSKGRTSFIDEGNLEDMDRFEPKFYDNASFSIRNTALFYEQDSIFLCEKIPHDITGQIPFIAISTPYTLEYLRMKGYRTFPELFDEGYDTILNHDKRMNFILKEIDRVMKMSDDELYTKIYSMRYKLEYNYERLRKYIEQHGNGELHRIKCIKIAKKIVEHAIR